MHLASLTLRGFKSFASSTTLRFEPGVTAIVGPNGSGKSNVVDAIAWVLGEQGAKSLRGGKMEDVIFAGTSGRPALGRAEVVLTIDNTDGALPIDFTEVTLSRIMFRNGGSEYAINGSPCRLLDIQELLSDSGIGREMHVIVGQGQLDAILSATPEERRGFIEEAAGVLKHRKRKEKALRKLDAMQVNLNRLGDLTGELRRQLKPLGQQADVARRASVIQADLRDARLRLLADDLTTLRGAFDAEVADETALLSRRARVEATLSESSAREAILDRALAEQTPMLARAQETWYRLAGLRERMRGTASLAAERQRNTAIEVDLGTGGRDPLAWQAEIDQLKVEAGEVDETLAADRERLAAIEAERMRLETSLTAEEQALAAARQSLADRREGKVRLHGEVTALRTRARAAQDEIGRLSTSWEAAQERAAKAAAEFAALEGEVAGLDAGEVDLDATHEAAAAALSGAEENLAALQDEERETERQRSAVAARRDALALGLERKDATAALIAARGRLDGLLGTVAELVSVETGFEAAIAAALGTAADAVAVRTLADAAAAIALLKSEDGGRAGLLVGAAERPSPPATGVPEGARIAIEAVSADAALMGALTRLLDATVIVDNADDAQRVVAAHPDLRAVTRDGDVFGVGWSAGGSMSAPSLLEIRAAHSEAEQLLGELSHRVERLRFALSGASEEVAARREDLEAAVGALHESDARLAAVAERLGQLGAAARATAGESERLARAVEEASAARDRDLQGLSALEERLVAAEAVPDSATPDEGERDRVAELVVATRSRELDARLAVRTDEERRSALGARVTALETAAEAESAARQRAAELVRRRGREAVVAAAVATAASRALEGLERSLDAAAAQRASVEQQRTVTDGELLAVRASVRDLSAELETLTGAVHRDEVARAEQRLRIEALEAKVAEEFGVEPDTLLVEYGPEVSVPPPSDGPPESVATPYDRVVQEKRWRSAERALALLGKINPLALEEFAALEERHKFLSEQLEDLKASRRDLLVVVKEVDERVEQVFREAYEDVAREFETVFSVLFPGGTGRLVRTEPNDWLLTGVDVEARPPGKKVKRLSLLSGGERSLTAIAMLVAIFRARPSPFYVLDEVEAALDDRNLLRLVELLAELKSTSQLIVVTHQKRTMEVADCLYGVSMRGDGITEVISQRLREPEPEPV
ncbi:MAG TPA: chromosome segregation protein SMC [Mycobacteriales bacterium]|nr:chromosome segregation protein SMC [Mycobacteriales bacterium]